MHIRPPDRLIRVTPLETRRLLTRRTLWWMVAGSLLLHLLIFLAFVFVRPLAPPPPPAEANNEVAMVFQNSGQTSASTATPNPVQHASTALGHPNGATVPPVPTQSTEAPQPTPAQPPQPQPQGQPQEHTQPETQAQTPPQPAPQPPTPETPPAPPTQPQPQVEASTQTPPQETPPQETPPQETPPQQPQPEAPQPPAPAPTPTPPPPPKVPPTVSLQPSDEGELALPPRFVMPQPPTPLPPLPPRPRPPPLPRPRITQQSVPRSSSGFPMPQNWSLSTGPGSLLAQKGTDVASTRHGSQSDSEYRHVAGADPGEDWAAELHRWASDHAYYPPQAAENGEEGEAVVQVTITRDGRVLSTDLMGRSGSQWLDAAWFGEWNKAFGLPHFPPGTPEDTTTIRYTIHYILVHRR